jgi:hypothetical protein
MLQQLEGATGCNCRLIVATGSWQLVKQALHAVLTKQLEAVHCTGHVQPRKA